MTTNNSPALILNDDIRAYLKTPEAKKFYEGAVTELKKEENVQLAKDLNDFMDEHGSKIAGSVEGVNTLFDNLADNSVKRQAEAQKAITQLANDIDSYKQQYLKIIANTSVERREIFRKSVGEIIDRLTNPLIAEKNLQKAYSVKWKKLKTSLKD